MIIKEVTCNRIDQDAIQRGDLIRAKSQYLDEPINGVVTLVNDLYVIVGYPTGIGTAMNHVIIYADELDEWQLQWTRDFSEVYVYPESTEGGENG